MSGLFELLENEGTALEVTGNAPLRLNERETVWLVMSGRVDVFAVPMKEGQQTGARIHLFRTETGQALFGVKSADDSAEVDLLATGFPGTSVRHLRRSQLMESHDPVHAEQVVRLIDGWVERLTAGVARERLPKNCSLLDPHKEIVLEDDGLVSPARASLWVRHLEGRSFFLGKQEFPLDTSAGPFPLAASSWLTTTGKTRLLPVATRDLMGASPPHPSPPPQGGREQEGRREQEGGREHVLWSSLDRFHQIALKLIALSAQAVAPAERLRLEKRSEADQRLRQASLFRLASVSGTVLPDDQLEAGEPDALLLACGLVGKGLGIEVRSPARSGQGRKRSDRLGEIAQASRFRTRRVLLTDDWRYTDNGPLLAFRKEDERPVALLPTSAQSYELADPIEQNRTPASAAVARSLGPFAYQLYRPLPSRLVQGWDLVRFGLQGCRKDIVAVVVLALAGGLLGLVAPIATGILFDRIVPSADRHQLVLIALALVVSAIGLGIFQLTRGIAILRVEGKMDSAVESGIWDRLLGLPVPFFRRYTAGDLTVRAMSIGTIRQLMSGVVVSSLLGSVFSFLNLGLLFFYDLRLAGVALVLMLVILGATLLTVWLELRYYRSVYEVRGKIAGTVLQFITGIARLRVAGAEERALAIWAQSFSTQKRAAFEARSIGNRFAVFNSAVPVVTSMAVFATVALLQNQGLTVGAFLAFSAAFAQVLAAAVTLASALSAVIRAVPLYERARPILEALPEVPLASSDPGELAGGIEISHVSFRYQADGPLILDDVSLNITPGAFVAFVGPSGSGKSTILRLLLGFETPTSGSIYYDRQDLAGLNLQAVRRQIGVVLQHGKVISGDMLTNIIGSSLLTLQDAWEAARLSGLEQDIRDMPMGMHTIVTEGGSTLSGGQRQRLMIARAIVSRPRIVLFDEATSSLDNATQAIVSKSLEDLKATRLVVAHRLSTIVNADWIYVLEGGKIVQEGRYADLIGQPGLFAELARRQLA